MYNLSFNIFRYIKLYVQLDKIFLQISFLSFPKVSYSKEYHSVFSAFCIVKKFRYSYKFSINRHILYSLNRF
jgi:hypothetical protein